MSMPANKRKNEHGNVLIYILVAVALLASLSFAVSQSGRGNVQQLNAERARLFGSEILEYATNLGNAVTQLKLRGCDESEINFDNPLATGYNNTGAPADNTCDVFHPSGGGLSWQSIPERARNQTASYHPDYFINATNQVSGTKTNSGDLAIYAEINLEVCAAINTLIGLDPADPPNTDPTFHNNTAFKFTGSFAQPASLSAYPNEVVGCFLDGGNGFYYFYKVLISR